MFHAVPAPLRLNPPGRSSDLRASVPHECMDGAGRTHARARLIIFFLFKIHFPKPPSLHVATIKALESTRVGGTNCDRNVNTCATLPNTVRCCRCERRCRHRWLAAACGRAPLPTHPPSFYPHRFDDAPLDFCLPLRLISRPVSWLGVDSNLCPLVCVAADGRAQASFCERGPVYLAVTAQGILFASLFRF